MRRTTHHAQLDWSKDAPLVLGVVADTHSTPNEAGLRHLEALQPAAILHAGDIGDGAVLTRLARVAPVHAVRGNIDTRLPDVPDELVLSLTRGGAPWLRLLLLHIAVYGPKLRADVKRRASAEDARLVVCGHSHVPFIGQEQKLTVFNPGSIGPRRFTLPILFGSITLDARGVHLRHHAAETGQPWLPPGA